MDILDNEASEDEAMRRDASFDRPSSHEANVELIEKERRYRDILLRAAASDETVRQKWDEWEGSIVQLTADEVSDTIALHLHLSIIHSRPSLKLQSRLPLCRLPLGRILRQLRH
jgi:programmed cell death 6-interacting protein